MDDKMDDSDLALEQAITKIDSGDDLSSGSDRESEETPAPVRVASGETGMLNGSSYQGEGPERVMEDRGSGGGGGAGGEQQRATVDGGQPHDFLQVPRSQVTLEMIFKDYKLFTMFRRFLKDQCILRNLNFWLACKHYHELPGGPPEYQEQLYKVAKAIYVKYIKMTAPQLVQVKASTKRYIKNILGFSQKSLSPSLFKPAQDEVWEIMQQNELRQFLASDIFGEMFGDVEDSMSMELAYTPVGGALRGTSPMMHQSSSEDSVSVTSCSTDGGGSELGRRGHRLGLPYQRGNRVCSSDTETKSYRSHHVAGPLAKKDKAVTREDFVAMVSERLTAVAKDRDHMRKRAQEQARQQGKSYEEIMATDWYDLPNSIKYDRFLDSAPQPMVGGDSPRGDLSPPHSPSLAPYPNPGQSKLAIEQGQLAQHEIQDAIKDLEITNQVSRNRRHLVGHPKSSSAASSILSYTSDSGVGDSVQWGTTASSMVASSRHVQRYVEGQNQLLSKTPQRDIAAKAAAITLINSSPHPEDLSHRVHHSLSGRHRLPQHQLHTRTTNYPGAYSSDDSGSFLTITSESDLFIPRRFTPANYSESDEPHHFSSRLPHRQLARPRRTGFKMHQTPPIVEPSHTPTSHSQTPRPSAPPPSSGIQVVYDIVDMLAQDAKRTPFFKKHPSSTISLGEFKDKIFNRKGQYRFFFKTVYEGIDGPLMEEISDDTSILPQFEGRIIARVESVA